LASFASANKNLGGFLLNQNWSFILNSVIYRFLSKQLLAQLHRFFLKEDCDFPYKKISLFQTVCFKCEQSEEGLTARDFVFLTIMSLLRRLPNTKVKLASFARLILI